jgi:Zn-dependent protease
MRDPLMAFSFPLGRLFGITIRVHLLFPVLALGLILRAAFHKHEGATEPTPGAWIDCAIIIGMLFFSVLAHEFGHCFAARAVNGDASDILMWPLGGLAWVDVPNSPRAHFLTAAAGPAVNLVIGLASGVALYFLPDSVQPQWNLLGYTERIIDQGNPILPVHNWRGDLLRNVGPFTAAGLLFQLCWVNYMLTVLNLILVGFPMDMGRMLQAVLWNYLGYAQSMLIAVYAGFVTAVVVALCCLAINEVLLLFLAIFIYVNCRYQFILLETGGEDGVFGYDFSQGYTSLERDEGVRTRAPRKPSWWQRWRQRRAALKNQREQETREAEDRRMDELLEKIQREGVGSLTDEERRFMKRVSDRLRNRD